MVSHGADEKYGVLRELIFPALSAVVKSESACGCTDTDMAMGTKWSFGLSQVTIRCSGKGKQQRRAADRLPCIPVNIILTESYPAGSQIGRVCLLFLRHPHFYIESVEVMLRGLLFPRQGIPHFNKGILAGLMCPKQLALP